MTLQLAPEELSKVWKSFVTDRTNQDLRNILIEHYMPLVKYHGSRVKDRLPQEVEADDLVSAGVFGLMDAIDAFDPLRGVKFETYCVPRIRGAMLDELRNMDWVPRLVRSRAKRLMEKSKELSDKLGRQPTHEELAEFMEMSPTELDRMMFDANAVNLVSLNRKWFETDGSKDISEIDLIEDQKGEDPTACIQKSDIMRLVTKGLNRNERMIIILYYYEEMTMKEVGMTLDLSESRVSQMHTSIVERLKQQLVERLPEFA
ncbi:MAG: FliA/WhiG family RNA polymerase sigma factor [Planctomycetaceae bacterium]|nr:FliA/WhiG family RNA polymerase sigma factor [Planctomycetaceae bacterium]